MEQSIIFGWQKEAVMAATTGVFAALALGLFVRGMLKGASRPYLWAWMLREGICMVAFAAQLQAGATYSLALSGAQVLSVIVIIGCIVALQPRMGRLDKTDWSTFAIAGLGLVLWLTSGNPLYGLLGAMLADGSATGMGIRAAIRKGTKESVPFWGCSFLAAMMAVFAAGGDAGWIILAAPLFSCLNASVNMLTVAYVRQQHKRRTPMMEPLIIRPDLV